MKDNSVLRYVALTGLFAVLFTPLLISGGMFFPFITGKNFVFRIITEIIFGAWAILALRDKQYRPKFSWILIGLVSFVGIMLIANIFGANPYKSFWSNFERMEGWVTLLHLLAYFIVAAGMMNTKKLWNAFFVTSIWVSSAMALYGMFQVLGVFSEGPAGARLNVSLGNAAYFGIYMVFNAFFSLRIVLNKALELKERGASLFKNPTIITYSLTFLLLLMGVFFSQTRGSLLGFIAGAFATALLIALFEKKHVWFRKAAMIKIGVIIAIIVAFLVFKDSSLIQNSPTLKRIANISFEERTTVSRFLVWNMAWQSFVENPILGTGQENFNYIFNEYYHPDMLTQEQWFDRAHNVILDWLTAGGILGFLAYMSIFGSVLYYIWKKDDEDDMSVSEKALFTGLLVAYFSHNFFVFDNIVSYFYFMSIIALFHTRKGRSFSFKMPKSYNSDWVNVVGTPVIMLVVVFSIYFFNIPAILQAQSLIGALQVSRSNPERSLLVWEETISFGAAGTQEAREQLIQTASGFARSDNQEIKEQYFALAEREMLQQLELDPKNTRLHVFMGTFYERYGLDDKAIEFMAEGLKYSPKKQPIMFQMGQVYINMGERQKAFDIIQEAYLLAPQFTQAQELYAVAAVYVNRLDILDELESADPNVNLGARDVLIRAYANTRQYDRLVTAWEQRLEMDPNNLQYLVSYGASLFEAGRLEEAVAAIESVVTLNPNFRAEADRIIEAMRNGDISGL